MLQSLGHRSKSGVTGVVSIIAGLILVGSGLSACTSSNANAEQPPTTPGTTSSGPVTPGPTGKASQSSGVETQTPGTTTPNTPVTPPPTATGNTAGSGTGTGGTSSNNSSADIAACEQRVLNYQQNGGNTTLGPELTCNPAKNGNPDWQPPQGSDNGNTSTGNQGGNQEAINQAPTSLADFDNTVTLSGYREVPNSTFVQPFTTAGYPDSNNWSAFGSPVADGYYAGIASIACGQWLGTVQYLGQGDLAWAAGTLQNGKQMAAAGPQLAKCVNGQIQGATAQQ